MEMIAAIIAGLVFVAFFKSSIRQIAKHTEDIVTTNVNESKQELVERSMDAYQDLIRTCGQDFKTPREIYDMMNKRQKRVQPTA